MSFSVKREKEDLIVTLRDNDNGTEATIFPRSGAILNNFSIQLNGRKLNVIDGFEDPADFSNNVEKKGFRSCKLSPYVCRIPEARYKFAGVEYHIGKFKLQDAVIHGLLYNLPFDVIEEQASADRAFIKLQCDYTGNDEGFPFAYTCTIEYRLEGNSALSLITTIENKSGGLMPISDGWHPYFKFDRTIDDLQLEFQSKEILEFNEGLVPTGKLNAFAGFTSIKQIGNKIFDNAFTLNFAECQPMCLLRDPQQKVQIEISPDIAYPYLQVYTPPHRKSIAIENLSSAPNAFNNQMGLITLNAGESKSFKTQYKISVWA